PTASLTGTVRVKLPGHQRDAALGPDGAANDAAVAAAMLKLLAAVLHDVPAEPVLFFPNTNGESNVPVKLTGVNVADKKLAITIEPMTPEEQAELLKHIREPQEEVATVRE
ncbi:MAG: hypothetical protein ACREIT_07585, partial [Tepidisphaeraceae bacterium]